QRVDEHRQCARHSDDRFVRADQREVASAAGADECGHRARKRLRAVRVERPRRLYPWPMPLHGRHRCRDRRGSRAGDDAGTGAHRREPGVRMRALTVPVSYGEAADKITILTIKTEQMRDPAKIENVRKELALLTSAFFAMVSRTPQFDA